MAARFTVRLFTRAERRCRTSRFCLIKGAGHLNPLIALSRELVARGHQVTFFQAAELEERVRSRGLAFCSIGTSAPRPATHSGRPYKWKLMREIVALRDGIARIVFDMEWSLRQTPPAMAGRWIDAIIMDEITLAGPTVAELLCLPYVVISTSIPHTFGWDGPRSIASKATLFGRVAAGVSSGIGAAHERAGPTPVGRASESEGLGPDTKYEAGVSESLLTSRSSRSAWIFHGPCIRATSHYAGPFGG